MLAKRIVAGPWTLGIFANERAIAPPGFHRWLIPPTVLAVHLCIGQVYALSVFAVPLTRVMGVTVSAPEDWATSTLTPLFTMAIIVLGLSTTIGGKWIERAGPRAAMFLAACCFGGGFLLAALGVATHQLWLVYAGYAGIGGVGLGFGYVAPVSALISWFPDRRGMAAGMAIMGFGGGAMIAVPLSKHLMQFFQTGTSVGIAATFIVMGLIYFSSMSVGAFAIRLPPPNWQPEGERREEVESESAHARPMKYNVSTEEAAKTPQFYLLWVLLCMNVTSGIGVFAHAPSVINAGLSDASMAPVLGFVSLMSLFNMAGRLIWSIGSDYIGRKNTYTVLLLLGALLYAEIPYLAEQSFTLLVASYALAVSIYGGCFAMIPAYIADSFGTRHLTSIHGRLLSAWSIGILGSLALNNWHDYQIEHGVPQAQADAKMLYVTALLLTIGLVCNWLMRPVNRKHHMQEALDDALGAKPVGVSLSEQAP